MFESDPKTAVAQVIPPSAWVGQCYPDGKQVSRDCNKYFLDHWPFASDKARRVFAEQDLPRWHCCQYPVALPDRQLVGAKFMVLMFLIDDMLDDMSLDEGASLYKRLTAIIKKEENPDRAIAVEWMMHDLWEEMRSINRPLTTAMEEPCFVFWQAQVDDARLDHKGLGEYMAYREGDVASALLRTLQRFLQNILLAETELERVRALEHNYTNHISVVNDVCSFEKELREAAKSQAAEGAVLSNVVAVLADEMGLSPDASKAVLWSMCRDWERQHEQMVSEIIRDECSDGLKAYMHGLELQMSGNELWSRTTPRYNQLERAE